MPETIYKSCRDIFSYDRKFKIPLYQREFSWDWEKIEQLLVDLDAVQVEQIPGGEYKISNSHFVGLLVFVAEKIKKEEYYSIVDGQQRLITVTLISAVAKSVIDSYIASNPVTGIESQNLIETKNAFNGYIFKVPRPFGKKYSRLIPNKNDQDLYEILVLTELSLDDKKNKVINDLGKKYLKKRMTVCYERIYEYLENKLKDDGIEEFIKFFVRLDDGLIFIPFIAEEDTDAFNLFETLNDRGLKLSALDLIKNKVLQNSSKKSLVDNEAIWSTIFGIGGVIPPTSVSQAFLRNFLMQKEGHISNSAVYTKCKKYLTSESEVDIFLQDLFDESEFYRDIVFVQVLENQQIIRYVTDDELAELFTLLNKTRVKQWQSIGLCLYSLFRNSKIAKNQIVEVLELLLNIAVRFKILNKRFNIIEKEFPRLAHILRICEITENGQTKQINQDDALSYVKSELDKIISNYAKKSDIQSTLSDDFQFEDNDLAYVILRKIAKNHIQHGVTLNLHELSLEHVLPEKHQQNWGSIKNVEIIKYSLGNMLLVNLPKNTSLGNKAFKDKKEVYKNIKILDLVNDKNCECLKAADQSDWIDNFVKKREKDFISQMNIVFNI